jgi:PAS domain S-box-containing protein
MTDALGREWVGSRIVTRLVSLATGVRDPTRIAHATQAEILTAVTESLAAYVEQEDWKEAFGRLLRCALDLTESEYGFIGVVVDGPVLRVLAHEGIVWDEVVNREFYDQALRHYREHGFLAFHNFDNLFGRAITTGHVIVANAPSRDPRARGLPPGHPPMHSFLGVPIRVRDQVTGLIALANRPRGYGEEESHRIETLVRHVGGMCESYRQRERARMEADERRKAEAALRESDERLRLVARASNDVIWDWNLQTDTVFMPEGFEKLVGGELGASLDMPVTEWYRRIHPDDFERVTLSIHRAIDSGARVWSEEYRFEPAPGIYATVLDRGYVLRNDNGHPLRMIGAMMDITERKQLEAQFRQSQKLEAVGQLAGGVAHDFNNILTVIQAHVSLLLGDTRLESGNGSLLQILDASERAAGLTRQLLAFSRKQVLQKVHLDLNEVVGRMTRLLARILGEDITLTVQPSTSPVIVRADASMMEQVILNLAVNARDAMPRGGELTLRTTIEQLATRAVPEDSDARATSFVKLTISDTGCGIPPAALSQIFEPFFTTKDRERGTGLGLATVYSVVNQHNGWVTVRSAIDVGTTFDIYLPCVGPLPGQEALPRAVPERLPTRGRETILIVEDDEPVRKLSCLLLERNGYHVLEAETGPAAVARSREYQGTVDLVLTDMVLPGGLSGIDLATELRLARPQLKVMLTSGYSPILGGKDLPLSPDVPFLAKPYTASQLVNAARDALDEHR